MTFLLPNISKHLDRGRAMSRDEWDLGDWFERKKLAEKPKSKLRPLLIQKLLEGAMDAGDAKDFIEEWVDRELELED